MTGRGRVAGGARSGALAGTRRWGPALEPGAGGPAARSDHEAGKRPEAEGHPGGS